MSFFEINRLRVAANGRFIRRPAGTDVVSGIGIDTRQPLDGMAYVAIRGQRHDGHAYLADAVRAGAQTLIIDDASAVEGVSDDVAVIQVEDTRQALGRLAAAYRRTWSTTRVIAVTGSCGKTTTKEMIQHVLSGTLRGTAAPRSFNNDIGVPLTILATRPGDQYVVLEIGTSAPGEIGRLSAIAQPDLAVITMIGRAHLEGFGSIEAIAAEKASILAHLRESGMAIVTADAPALRSYLKLVDLLVLFGEQDDADLRLTDRGRDEAGWWLTINDRQTFRTGLSGAHNARNALATIAVARRMGLPDDEIGRRLATVQPPPMRMCRVEVGGVTFLNDAYNANPDSMLAGLDAFEECDDVGSAGGRRVLVIGDMLELGESAETMHRELAGPLDALRQRGRVDELMLVGPMAGLIADELTGCWPADRIRTVAAITDDAALEAAATFKPGDVVMLKGSRAMELERLIDAVGWRIVDAPAQAGDEHRAPSVVTTYHPNRADA